MLAARAARAGNASKLARVHVVATRFLPAFAGFDFLGRPADPGLAVAFIPPASPRESFGSFREPGEGAK